MRSPNLHYHTVNAIGDGKGLLCSSVAEVDGVVNLDIVVDNDCCVGYYIRFIHTLCLSCIPIPFALRQINGVALTSYRIVAVDNIHMVAGDNARTLCVAEAGYHVSSGRVGCYNDRLVEAVGNTVGHVAGDTVTERRCANKADVESYGVVAVADIDNILLQCGNALVHYNCERRECRRIAVACDTRISVTHVSCIYSTVGRYKGSIAADSLGVGEVIVAVEQTACRIVVISSVGIYISRAAASRCSNAAAVPAATAAGHSLA